MKKLRATRAKLIFAVILLIPFQVLAESDLEPNEEKFESVCRDYDKYGSFTKCEDVNYNFEIPLIYKHEFLTSTYSFQCHHYEFIFAIVLSWVK